MKLIQVGTASINTTPLDFEGNREKIVEAIEKARTRGVELLLLPELVLSGYGCEDFFQAQGTLDAVEQELAAIIPETKGMIVAVGLPFALHNLLFNGVALIVDGALVGIVVKQNLANDGIHYESRWFTPWNVGDVDEIQLAGFQVPVGDMLFEIDGVRIGFEICEDAWVAQRPGRRLATQGVDIICNPSASHFSFGKHEVRKHFILDGARAFNATYLYANLLGNEAGRVIYDGGNIIAAKGKLLQEAPRFGFDDVVLIDQLVDVSKTFKLGKPDSAVDDKCEVLPIDFTFSVKPVKSITIDETPKMNRFEEFSYAVSLGLFDYMRKSWSKGILLSLSGGADSTAVAVLVWLMYQRGIGDNKAFFQQKLAYLLGDTPEEQWMEKLLMTLYQASENSGEVTKNAAATIAEAVGAQFHLWSIDEERCSYTAKAENMLGTAFNWERDDITLQNIQARVRVPGLWMVANYTGALLVSTSNRSEAAVGYATMDGDTSGGISPLAGIDKAFLLKWLQWMETTGLKESGPLPALVVVNEQQPTAELRPQDAAQTDEDDLMPYEVLVRLEKLAIRDKRYPIETCELLEAYFPQSSEEQRIIWVVRFFRLWSRNQWKRERYAPSFHLDDINLDPKSFCRFPILSGGFKKELYELEQRRSN